MTLKQKIHDHYLQLINNKVNMLQITLADLKDTGANETKSTAGDKHETALAMIQIEQANTRTQLSEMMLQKEALDKINPAIQSTKILPGTCIKTDRGYLYLGVALGKITVEGITVTALSPQSPLGKKLLSLSKNDTAEINGTRYIIEDIF